MSANATSLLFYGICLETSVWLLYYGGVPKKPLMVGSFIAGILMAYGLVEIIMKWFAIGGSRVG